jgi:hypothetical protein
VITIATKRRRLARRAWVALAIMGALAAASCADKQKEADRAKAMKIEKLPEKDRALNQTELDSLRSMKITHRVTRDEYWDLQGGVVANDRVEVWYSNRKIYVLQAMAVLKQMDQMADQIQKSFGKLPAQKLVVLTAPDLDTFRKATGLDWWQYALIKGDTLSMQTPMTLYMRGLLQVAARREYSRWVMEKFTAGKAPQWFVWGTAAYLGGERDVLGGQRTEYQKEPLRMDVKDIEEQLSKQSAKEGDRLETRRALYNAYLMVNQLVETHGMPSVAAFALALAEQPDADAAAKRIFSKSFAEVLAEAQAWKEPLSTTP